MKFIISLLILNLFFTSSAFAIDATSSSDKQKDIINLVQQKVKEKLNLITEPSNKPKSFIGTISKIEDGKIVINYQSTSKTIIVDDQVAYVDIKRNKSKFENLKVGQDIIAMGYLNQENQLTAKRIVATTIKDLENKNEVVIGKIVDISTTSSVLVLIPNSNKNNQYQIKTDSDTEFLNNKNQKSNLKDISVGQKVIVVIKPDAKIAKTFDASKIINLDSTTASPTPTSKN